VLEGKATAAADRPWGNELYRELKPSPSRSVDIKLIPYYAWANRGKSEMTVWMPLGRSLMTNGYRFLLITTDAPQLVPKLLFDRMFSTSHDPRPCGWPIPWE